MRDTIAHVAFSVFKFLAPISVIAFLICLFLLLPLSFLRRTGAWAASGLFIASYLFGATVWCASCALTFSYFGWFGLIIGLIFAGMGVFPLALWALFVGVNQYADAFVLIGMFVVTILARLTAVAAISRLERL